MDPNDMEKTAFITPYGIFCYRVMPFGLKNSCATFNRAIFKMMHAQIGHTLEAYVDDLVLKSQKESNHLQELKEIFDILKFYKLHLNPEKCAFGVSAGKFLEHLVTRRGIEADPNQIKAIADLRPPRTIKEVQRHTGMAATLNRFISKSSDKCHVFFNALKEYLSSAPLLVKPKEFKTLYLYLAVFAHAVSSALVRRGGADEKPIYFTSKTLLPAQTRYLPLEKLALALVLTARKLLHYFQSHPITVLTKHPLKALFWKADLSNRVSKWAVKLANFDISFEPRTAIKGQVLADFIAELTPADTAALNAPTPPDVPERSSVTMPWHLFQGETWRLNVDGASNSNGAGAGVVLVSPCGTLHESSLTIDFPATNNEAEYEALLAGLRSAIAMKVTNLVVYCDSQLIVNQVLGDYEARDPRILKYQATTAEVISQFCNFSIKQINREHNAHADALAGLASASTASEFRTINFGSIGRPSFEPTPKVLNVELGPSWMDEIVTFLKHDTLPIDKKEAYRVRNKPAQNLSPITSPWPFAQWGLDIVGKLPTAPGGFKFLIITTDYFSKWVEAEPLITTTEADVRRFVWRNIVTRFGIPYDIVSDNGTQFVGKDLTNLCAEFGIRFFNSTPAYPQGNGQAEATNKTVCAGIKRRLNSKRGKWTEELPRVLWAYRSTPRHSTGQTPFSMAFGMEAVIPLESKFPTLKTETFNPKTNDDAMAQELILAEEKCDDARLHLTEYQQQVAKGYNRSVRVKKFKPDDLVWRKVVQASKKTKFKPNWEGPFRIVKIVGEGAYNLKKAYM
ncbi:uncharacterized protein LOC131332814 [Rhododendron vialii]|uniref:uncharacterized protein LOC131332814 n=1 Tax=Rhododendron vialii TaxID=182163 RepID=UPI00265D8DB7|nr:uncharacterized protein LOC131332814 [Rhododendron vialii]